EQTPFWREDAVLVQPIWLRLCRVGSRRSTGHRCLDPQITNRAPPGGPVGPGSHWAVRSPGSDEPRAAYQGCDPVNRGIWGTSDSRTMAASWTINCDL